MTLTELRYLVAVAREHHFGRAAQSCFVSQPTLSIAIKKLEEELGISLFERNNKEISITQSGEPVIQQAQRVLDEVERLKQIATEGHDELAGPIRIGAIYTIAPYLLPHLIPTLREDAPKMPLLIEENFTTVLGERLKQGEVDVIIVALPFEGPGIEVVPLYEEPFVVLLPSSHPWIEKDKIDPVTLSEENLLLLGKGHCFRDQVLQVCPSLNRSSQTDGPSVQTLESGSLETIRHMVASGIGLTVVPCTAAGVDQYAQRLMRIKRFTQPIPQRTVAIAWRKSFTRPKAITTICKAILQSDLSCIKQRPLPTAIK